MSSWSPGQTLESIEKIAIQQAYKFYRGNKTQTALSLGISVRTLDTKLENYDADRITDERARAQTKANNEAYLQRSRGLHRTASGVLLESSTPAVAQHTLPVQKPKEVQEVLQADAGKGSPKRARK